MGTYLLDGLVVGGVCHLNWRVLLVRNVISGVGVVLLMGGIFKSVGC